MVNIAIGQVRLNGGVQSDFYSIIQNGPMIRLTMDVLLNNFVLVRQILAMLGAVVKIMSKVKMTQPYQALWRLKVQDVEPSYYSDFTNTCTDGQIWSDWGEWGDCNYVTRTKKRYRECLAGDPYCKGKLEGQQVILKIFLTSIVN